jgi:hypothetical protein
MKIRSEKVEIRALRANDWIVVDGEVLEIQFLDYNESTKNMWIDATHPTVEHGDENVEINLLAYGYGHGPLAYCLEPEFITRLTVEFELQ